MIKTRFHTLLEVRVQEQINQRSIQIMTGGASDYPAYREAVGYILGLNDALRLCEEIEKENE